MIEETGVVTAINNQLNTMSVSFTVKSTCSTCVSQSNCGTGTIARAFSPQEQIIELPLDANANVGDSVKVGIHENAVVSASLYVYVLPTLTLILSAVLASILLSSLGIESEWLILLIAGLTTFACYRLVSRHFAKHDQQLNPQMLELAKCTNGDIFIKQIDSEIPVAK